MPSRLLQPGTQFVDPNGRPYSGGKIETYESGTSTPKPTYSDAGLTIPNANPVILDSAGRLGPVFSAAGAYKIILKDAADVSIFTADPVDGATSTGASASGSAAFRNVLINGGFAVNQRNLTSVADDAYCLDRWYALTESGNVTVARQTLQETGQPTSIRLTQPDVSAKRIGLAQIVESNTSQGLRGVDVALSGRVRCSVSQTVRYAILEHTGTADSVTSDVVNNWGSTSYTAGGFFLAGLTVVATGSVTPAAATWTALPTITGTVSASCNNLIVMMWISATLVQNATLDFGLMQLEQGAVASAFERRPLGTEIGLCHRYHYGPTRLNMSGYNAAGASFTSSYLFPVEMRAAPTVTNGAVTNINCSTFVTTGTDPRGFLFSVTVTALGGFAAVTDATATIEL